MRMHATCHIKCCSRAKLVFCFVNYTSYPYPSKQSKGIRRYTAACSHLRWYLAAHYSPQGATTHLVKLGAFFKAPALWKALDEAQIFLSEESLRRAQACEKRAIGGGKRHL